MQVQNIQNNTPNFNGRVALIGKLSEIPAKCVKNNVDKLSDLLYPKKFDLYIEELNNNFLDIIVAKTLDSNKTVKPKINRKVYIPLLDGSDAGDLFMKIAQAAVDDYSKIKQPLTFKEKTGLKLSKAMNKFLKVFQDEDEV